MITKLSPPVHGTTASLKLEINASMNEKMIDHHRKKNTYRNKNMPRYLNLHRLA